MTTKYDMIEILSYLDPVRLNYQEWLSVGQALHYEGFRVETWESWSRRDPARFHERECQQKWAGFRQTSNPVTAGTIVQLARDHGWSPGARTSWADDPGHELDWSSEIGGRDEQIVVDENWIEELDIPQTDDWSPAEQIIRYLEILFEPSEYVGYVTESWTRDGKYIPTKGAYDRTAVQLITELKGCNGDIGRVVGDYNPEAGAWIRFNPLDGMGVRNDNVANYRYALVESDSTDIEKQYAIIHELELPVAVMVHSGRKSLHAIVRIEASDYDEYRKRVDFLYGVCQKNGLKIDSQNRNPSRLSRMPGITRNGNRQYIVAENIGKGSYAEWREWIEGVNDDLPEPESMRDAWDNLPELAPPLIDGVLRQGHKMLLAGPSKAGKSFMLIGLCIATAEGKRWLNWQCAQGRVLYVNLELDRASCLHRFRDVYDALGIEPKNLRNIDIWNLRGKAIPMDKLAPKLIRRAAKRQYIAVILDPIYKVITGDENAADEMAKFCNQFDTICTELGCAVIYCHHHSKGMQGQKRSMDRASGSGVFARDPDALLDMIELKLPEAEDGQDVAVKLRTAWRIEGTMREFPALEPINLWFDHPIHIVDETGELKEIRVEGQMKEKIDRAADRQTILENAYNVLNMNGKVMISDVIEYTGLSRNTVRAYIDEHPHFIRDEGKVIRLPDRGKNDTSDPPHP